jgi:hypothetical protein
MQEMLNSIVEQALVRGPEILAALAILVIGWLVALFVALLVRMAMKRTQLGPRLAVWLAGDDTEDPPQVEKWVARGVFWVLMLFVLVAFFEALGLRLITEPLNGFLVQVFEYLPNLIGPAILVLVAFLIATGLRFVVQRVVSASRLEGALAGQAGLEEGTGISLSQTMGDAVYWLVYLLFLPAILGALKLDGLLGPVQGMVDELLGFLPNLLAAGLILGVGWLLARIVQRIVSNLLAALGADRLSEQVGLSSTLGEQKLSGLIGLVVYVLILVPVLIASLNALSLEAITRPASEMLNTFLSALPLIFAATLVLVIAFFVARIVSGLVTNLLTGVGFNNVLVRLGVRPETTEGQRTPSEIAGYLVLVAIMLFATVEAVDLLGFAVLSELVKEFMVFAGRVLLGLIIFAIGLFLANLAASTVSSGGGAQARLLAVAARGSILVLAGAMALRQMGLANEIIVIAFGLLLGAIAVAVAIAFGIGGRDLAADLLQEWRSKVQPTISTG